MQTDSLIVKNLCKSYGNHRVLQDVTFKVKRGEFLCVIGLSGCGKTTLLRVLAGFEPYVGDVVHDGNPIEKPSPERFMVFQDLEQLLPWKTVRGNIRFGEVARGTRSAALAEDLISLIGLEGFENHYSYQLSGGMKQRVAIARALFMNPSVLLMDEPFGSLDARTRAQMRVELLRIWQRVQKTVVFVTHNIREAVQLADRVLVLSRQGTIKGIIPIILSRPRDLASPGFNTYWRRILNLLEAEPMHNWSMESTSTRTTNRLNGGPK